MYSCFYNPLDLDSYTAAHALSMYAANANEPFHPITDHKIHAEATDRVYFIGRQDFELAPNAHTIACVDFQSPKVVDIKLKFVKAEHLLATALWTHLYGSTPVSPIIKAVETAAITQPSLNNYDTWYAEFYKSLGAK